MKNEQTHTDTCTHTLKYVYTHTHTHVYMHKLTFLRLRTPTTLWRLHFAGVKTLKNGLSFSNSA